MIGSNLLKHINEFRNYIRNRQYEVNDAGIYFAKAGVSIAGTYIHDVNGEDEQTDKNIITDEGLNHMLNVVLLGTPVAELDYYCMIHSGTGTPTSALTSANYDSTLSEITSATEGYNEATRILWSPDAVDTVNTEVTNLSSPATFTIVTAGTLAVNGAALTSVSTKGSGTGVLMSAVKFAAQRNLSDTDEFNLKYKVDFDSV